MLKHIGIGVLLRVHQVCLEKVLPIMLSRREKQDFEKGLVRVHYFLGLWTLGYHCSFLVTVFIDGIGQVHEISNKENGT